MILNKWKKYLFMLPSPTNKNLLLDSGVPRATRTCQEKESPENEIVHLWGSGEDEPEGDFLRLIELPQALAHTKASVL